MILAVLALSAWLLGGTVPRAAFFLWIGLGVVDAGWAWLSLRQLGVIYRGPAATLTAGDGIEAELHIDNDGWLPVAALTVRDGPEARVRFTRARQGEVMAMGAFDGLPQMRRMLSAQRGRYRLGPLQLRTSGPFGVAESVREVWSPRTLTVLPRLKPLPAWPVRRREPLAGRANPGSPFEDPVQVAGARPLLPSDPPRRIHWKRSARSGTWQVKEMEPAAGTTTLLMLDLHAGAYAEAAAAAAGRGSGRPAAATRDALQAATAALCDDAVEIVAAIAHAGLARGDQLAFYASGRTPSDLPPRRGTGAVAPLLEALAQAQPDGQRAIGDWLRQDLRRLLVAGQGTLVVVTPAPGERWAEALAATRRLGVEPVAVQVLARGADRALAHRRTLTLRRLGVTAWAARDAEDLAALIRAGLGLGAGVAAPREEAVAAGGAGPAPAPVRVRAQGPRP